ncbi:hypothetical protein HGRIS_003418 [Hohenbuehelia grisea]|uniref:Store-operated calcium entry-associated regulatory factor n=1 Tax=Hohenbuehelia grisea TaxID=104357 RepID=A0ABR3JFE2_9AGAR
MGGSGAEIDWKCEADLPESLRFGRVEVSCEGWARPGDSFVLKGSCSLEYKLVEVPNVLRKDNFGLEHKSWDLGGIIFTVLWLGVLFFIVYSFLQSCFSSSTNRTTRPTTGPRPGGGSGWFPGGSDSDPTAPPPPYSKHPSQPAGEGWRPGFWTGAALGGLGASVFNNRRRGDTYVERRSMWDWDRPRGFQSEPMFTSRRQFSSSYDDDRGEGSSTMRRSTGFGGSNVR